MEAFPETIRLENEKYFPFLGATTILMEAVKAGAGRETAHEAIKEHALATIRDLRSGRIKTNDLLKRLAADDRLPLSSEQLDAIFRDEARLCGMARHQVDRLAKRVEDVKARYPEAVRYQPSKIL